MKKELLKIAGALVLLFGLIVLIWWHRKGMDEATVKTEKEEKLVQIDWDHIDRMTLSSPVIDRLTFERRKKDDKGNYTDAFASLSKEMDSPPQWLIVEPIQALPDHWTVHSFIQALQDLKSTKMVNEKGERPADYHLDSPVAKVELFEGKATIPKLVIRFGDENSSKSSVYLQTSENPKIVLSEKSLDYLKTRKLFEWRSKEIVNIKDFSQVNRVSLQYLQGKQKGNLTAVKEGGKWNLTEPQKLPADGASIDMFLNQIKSLRAEDIVSEDAKKDAVKYGFQQPYVTISISAGEDLKKLVVGGKFEKGKEFFIRREGVSQVFSVTSTVQDQITPDYNRWVAKAPFGLSEDKVTGLTIITDGRTELLKKDGKWFQTQPIPDRGDEKNIAALIQKLTAMKGLELLKGLSTKSPQVLEIQMTAGDEKRSLKLFMPDPSKNLEGKATNPDLTLSFAKSEYLELIGMLQGLRSTNLVPDSPEELSSVEFEDGKSKVLLARDEKKGDWFIKSIQDVNIKDPSFPKNFLDALGELKIYAFLDGSKPEALGKVEGKLQVKTKTGEIHIWSFGKKSETDQLVYSEKRKALGRVRKDQIKRLESLMGILGK